MRVFCVMALLLALAPLAAGACHAQAAQKAQGFLREQERQKANENVVVLMSGALGSSYLHLADDIAIAVADGDNMRVVPAIGGGEAANVRDVLLMRGVDLGITTVQMLESLKASGEFGPGIDKQIAYIAPLSVETLHLLAGPGIESLQDLKGKQVAFGQRGSGTARFGPNVLKALGVEVAAPATNTYLALGDAMQAIRRRELVAVLSSGPVPVPALTGLKPGSGFKLLELPYAASLQQDYLPARFGSEHYPGLIAPDGKLQTLATNTVLVTFNWAPGSERYKRTEKFVHAFFSNASKLREPARHPAWASVNLAATISGWPRFQAAQEWLDRRVAATYALGGIDIAQVRAQARRAAPGNPAEQERLIKEYVEWARQRQPATGGIDMTQARALARRAAPGNPAEQERLIKEWQQQKQPAPVANVAIGIDMTLVRAQARRAAPGNPVEQERLMREFIEWTRQQR
jgi:uncharacterized protein